jgi:hypothetical protein
MFVHYLEQRAQKWSPRQRGIEHKQDNIVQRWSKEQREQPQGTKRVTTARNIERSEWNEQEKKRPLFFLLSERSELSEALAE